MIQYFSLSTDSFLFFFSTNFTKELLYPLFSSLPIFSPLYFTQRPYSLICSIGWVKCTPTFFLAKCNDHFLCLSPMFSQQYLMSLTTSLKLYPLAFCAPKLFYISSYHCELSPFIVRCSKTTISISLLAREIP